MKITKIIFLALTLTVYSWMGSRTVDAAQSVVTTITLTGTKNLISLPCVPSIPDPLSVFSGFNINNNLTSWDPVNQIENKFNSALPETFGGVLLGEGYWLTGTAGQSVQYQSLPSGIPTDETLTDTWIPLPGEDNGINNGGRHLVGCPYDTFVPISNIYFTNSIEILSWSQANAAGWVGPSISYWTDSSYSYINCNGPTAVTVIQPGKGYWVESKVDNLAMIITAPLPGHTLSATVNLGSFDSSKRAGIPVNIQLRIGAETVRTVDTTLDASGKFYIHNVQPGTYDVGIKPSHWLRRVVPAVTVTDADLDFIIR